MKLSNLLILLLIGALSIVFITGCTTDITPVEETELLICAAASMTDVLEEISEAYKTIDPTTKLIFTFGSSGALQTQIEEGAPVDIFISAAQKQMTSLEEGGQIINETKKTLLVNKVVLITPTDSTLNITSFEDLIKSDIKIIGLGEPSGVPVGQYSQEVFTSLNMLEQIKTKAVYGSDVRTVLMWVESGEVDCGVVYATDAYSNNNVKIMAEAPEESHKEVTYPVAVIKNSKNIDSAKAFLDYLSTGDASKIFIKYGFTIK